MRAKTKICNFIHWKGKATCRKGMGMELALLVLFVVFACSILLVSSAILGKGNLTNRKDTLTERLALDMVAEQAMKGQTVTNENYAVYKRVNNAWVPMNGGPAVDAGVADDAKWVVLDGEGKVKLSVSCEDGKITGWDYH